MSNQLTFVSTMEMWMIHFTTFPLIFPVLQCNVRNFESIPRERVDLVRKRVKNENVHYHAVDEFEEIFFYNQQICGILICFKRNIFITFSLKRMLSTWNYCSIILSSWHSVSRVENQDEESKLESYSCCFSGFSVHAHHSSATSVSHIWSRTDEEEKS